LGALFLIEYAFLELLPSLHEALRNLTATIVGGIVGLAGMETVVSGPLITLQDPSLAFNIFRMALSLYLQELTGVYVHDYFHFFNIVFVLLVWAVWTRTLRVKAAVVSSAT
jgi:hypothetical protein